MAEFQLVNKRSNKKKNRKMRQVSTESKLTEICQDMRSTQFCTDTLEILKKRVHNILPSVSEKCQSDVPGSTPSVSILCYGLGNFAESYIARYQLAFLMVLREEFWVPMDKCEVYDPQFTPDEISSLHDLNMKVQVHNTEGKSVCPADCVSLLYMPHCGKALYNNVLWSNWGPQLHNLVIIGNSFSSMVDRTPARILNKTANYVIKILPYTEEDPLSVATEYEDIFNDTSIHTFISHNSQEVPKELWDSHEEPVYDSEDAEIIFK